jgi:hypothetical protein
VQHHNRGTVTLSPAAQLTTYGRRREVLTHVPTLYDRPRPTPGRSPDARQCTVPESAASAAWIPEVASVHPPARWSSPSRSRLPQRPAPRPAVAVSAVVKAVGPLARRAFAVWRARSQPRGRAVQYRRTDLADVTASAGLILL